MLTGLRKETFKNLQLNAGVFLVDFDYDEASTAEALASAVAAAIADPEKCLGATIGGGTFVATPEERQIEVDGMRYPVIGSTVYDSWDIRMTGTMKEVTAQNMKRAMSSADVQTSGKVTTITMRTATKDEDYIPNLVWVGDTSEGYMLIDLENALNVAGVNMTFTDKGEGSLPFEFRAHKSMDDLLNNEAAPVKVVFFEK